jgi:CubicO group peptidase (beta-lactamase class C family)
VSGGAGNLARDGHLAAARAALDRGLGVDHPGYQLYVSVDGEPWLDAADGDARTGVPMDPSTITMWFSSGKVVTAVAVAQLWERRRLDLDDRVTEYLPGFAAGKEAATVRHLLTHTAGFPFADDSLHPTDWDAMVRDICASPALWPPGTAAGYHGTSAHIILGEVVRIVDGRPIDRYIADEVFAPLGITNSYVALPCDSLDDLRPRLADVHDLLPREGPDAIPGLEFEQYNTDDYLCALSPGNTCRGPARELGRVYDALLGGGAIGDARILERTTVEAVISCHRRGLVDQTFAANGARPHPKWGHEYPWGLGVALDGNGDVGRGGSSRVFGCSGAFSSVGFADPEVGLVCVIVTNGLIPLHRNEDRLAEVADHVHAAARAARPGAL